MKLLFVCTGNTCRSCMAEAIFNDLCTLENVKAYSTGIAVIKNSSASYNTCNVLKANMNIEIKDRQAVQLTRELIEDTDVILAMTEYIKMYLKEIFPNKNKQIYTLNEYIGVEGDVVDPYGGDMDIYLETFKQLKNNILLLIDQFKKDNYIVK